MGLCWCKRFKMCAFRTKENKQNGTRSRELSSKLQRFVQLFHPLFSQYFKVVGVFVVVVVFFFFCLIKFNVILFNVTRRFRAKFANFVWLWGMMSVISLGIWSNISSGCAPEPTAWAHFVLIFIVNFCFVSLSHTFLVDSLVEMTCLTASPFRSNAAGLWW